MMEPSAVSQQPSDPSRRGFAVKVLDRTGLKSNDSRRRQSGPHLRVSIGYLDATFDYLAENWIDPADFIAFLEEMNDTHFDVMLEAKQKDLALLRLRQEIASAGLAHRIR